MGIKSSNSIRDARVLHEISLLPSSVRVAAGRRPVAMAAGYFDAPPKEVSVVWKRRISISEETEEMRYQTMNLSFK